MMKITKKLKMDILEKQNVQVVYTVQNDANTRSVELNLFSGGFPWVVPDGVAISVAYRKPDKTSGWYDKLPDGSDAYSVDGNAVTITFAPQVMTVAGLVKATVIFQNKENLNQIAVFPFDVVVEENPASGNSISNSYYNYSTLHELNEALGDVCVGWDGTIYPTAGQAVRGQFNEFNMQMEDLARTVDEVSDCYYETFSKAIADINGGIRTGKCNIGEGTVKVVTGNTGKATVILLDDCYEEKTVTISADVDIALAGHTLSFTTAGAYLNFASGKCAIWGNVPGSRIINENLSAAEQVKLFSVLCERLEVHGGEYRMTGTIDKTSMMFQIARVNQYCLFEDCTVYSDIYSTGDSVTEVDGVTKVAGFYQFANITNTGGNTVVKGGSWSVCTSGNNRAVMFSNVGTLTAEGVAIEVEAVNHNAVAFMNQAATVGEEQKYGTFHIRNCAISVRTDAEVIFNSFGVFNQYSGTVCHISDSTLFTDSRDFDTHEDGLGTWAVAIQNAVGATCYVTNVVAHGTHSCLSNQGKMYVNGGTYTGFCHGGIYCIHGAEGEAFVNDAHLRDGHYEGIYPDHYETNKIHSVGGFYIGGGESEICSNMSAYFDGCTIEGVYRAFVMRGSSGEHNNKAYLSNCEISAGDVARAINIHNDTHRVYLTNCNYGKENATLPNCVIYTDSLYRKSANDKDLNTLVDYASKTAEIAKTLIVSLGLEDNGKTVADKTFEEIQKAYFEGRKVVVVDAEGVLLSIVGAPDGGTVVFSANLIEVAIIVTIYADNTVDYQEILLSDLIPSVEVDPEAIEDAVEKYLTENPPAGGDGWTKLGDVTLTGITLPITAVSDGVLTIDITNGDPTTDANLSVAVLRKPDFSAYMFGILVKTDVAGQYTMKNMDREVITPDETYLDYVVEVPDANKLEIAIDGDFEYFKTRISAPAILWHGARASFISNIRCFGLSSEAYTKSGSAGEYIAEMRDCPIDGYMYVSQTLSIGRLANTARFDAFYVAEKQDAQQSAYISHNNGLLTIGTRFELWGKK